MKKPVDTALTILLGAVLLGGGVALLVWGIGQLRQTHESKNWPQVEGRIIRSAMGGNRGENRPVVEYEYVVNGERHSGSQISFDIFDGLGGSGRSETILARYPIGKPVTVYHHPDRPATAILEPEVYSPFYRPLFGGVLLVGYGVWILWGAIRKGLQRTEPPPWELRSKLLLGTLIGSVLVYAIMVLVSLDSAAEETFERAFGTRPLGLPTVGFVVGGHTLLFLPFPYIFWHGMQLAMQDNQSYGLRYLLTVGHRHSHLRWSQLVCIVGLAYFLLVAICWIFLAALRGI